MRFFILFFLLCLSVFCTSQTNNVFTDGKVGIHCKIIDDTVVVSFVVKNAPAYHKGIVKGDKIIQVDSIMVSGTNTSLKKYYDIINGPRNSILSQKFIKSEDNSIQNIEIEREESMTTMLYVDAYDVEYITDTMGNYTIGDVASAKFSNKFITRRKQLLTVGQIQKGSVAEKNGIQVDDLLLTIDNRSVSSSVEVEEILDGYANDSITLSYQHDSMEYEIHLGYEEQSNLEDLLKCLGIISLEELTPESNVFWMRIKLSAKMEQDRNCLIYTPGDTSELYIFNEDSSYTIRYSGEMVPFCERDFKVCNNSDFNISFRRNESKLLYIKITNGKKAKPAALLIRSAEKILKEERVLRFVVGLFVGIILIMVIYNLILLMFIREIHYLYYVLYILSFGFLIFDSYGYSFELLWPNSPRFNFFINLVGMGLFLFFLLFGQSYINTKKHLPQWNKWINIQVLLTTLVIIFAMVDEIFLSATPDYISVIGGIILLMSLVTILGPAIILSRKKHRDAKYFVLANLAIIIAIVIGNFVSIAHANSYLIVKSFQLGILAQIIIFSIGLGEKIRLKDKEKQRADKKVIDQLKENELLQTKVNRELEHKVKERTQEISYKNEELNQQKEEVLAQRDEIEAQRDSLSEQKNYLQIVNEEVEASIQYAEKIQFSMLPDECILAENLSDHFILFKPRDIVSGDFYWFRKVKNFLVITAADCTGHGVPGAFMSMLGVSFLNDIVSKSRFDSSDLILNRLRDKVKSALKQKGDVGENKDGMDMALCVINLETLEMQYSGAYNPLYILRDKELIQLKADRMPIAVYVKEEPFTLHNYQLEKNDSLYLFSDGYVDQFGGPKGKKFMGKQFKSLLLDNHHLSMNEQKHVLDKTFEEWKNKHEQMDDVIVMGLKM